VPSSSPADQWRRAGRSLVAKALGEFAYEELLTPCRVDDLGRHVVELAAGVTYAFHARRGGCGAWRVEPGSVRRRAPGREESADDPVRLVLDARRELGLDGRTAAEVVRELTATQAADARLLAAARPAGELADLPYAELEGQLTGHPSMVLNKGRLGFSGTDAARYTPEGRRPLRVVWAAAHAELASYHGLPGLSQEALLATELDPDTRRRFAAGLAAAVADPGAYLWLPVHPWQWDEVVIPLFAPCLADRRIVPLGEAPDRYLPLQSVRTLANVDDPGKRNVKLPLLIRNTLVWRGLSAAATAAAPDVTAWLLGIRDRDPFLAGRRFVPLGEVAAVAVRHAGYEEITDAPYRFHELLGAVWREPVEAFLAPGERARALAALLHVDEDGRALVAELVERSGLAARAWLRLLAAALLPGLLRYLYRHGVAFCPHGENTVVLFDARDVPVGVAVKDLAEDVNLLPEALPDYADLPPAAAAVLLRWPAEQLAHSIQSALVAGHFRHFAGIVADHLGLPEPEFWQLVRAEITAWHERFPELADRVATFGLLAPSFDRVALNREQLTGGGFHDRSDRDADFDLTHGAVPNPLAS